MLISFTPLSDLTIELGWSPEDSTRMGELARENHRLTYVPPERLGISEEELQAQRRQVKEALDAMTDRLKEVRERPTLLSRILLVCGLALCLLGWLSHLLGGHSAR